MDVNIPTGRYVVKGPEKGGRPAPYRSGVDPAAETLARRLLDAQVAYHLDRLTGDHGESTVRRLVADVLDGAGKHRIDELVDPATVQDVVVRTLGTVPGSAAVREIVALVTTVVHEGPAQPFPLGVLVEREGVERLLDELLALHPVLERALERLTDSPLVGTMASRFMGRIVGEVLQANKAMTEKVPGLGSLMSFGTSAATRAMGAADKQFESWVGGTMGGTVGGTVGKGGTYAVRRLNKIVIETLRDPTTRAALMQVWDLMSEEPVAGLARYTTRDELSGVVDAVHDLAVTSTASDQVAELARAIITAFFERFGRLTPTELLDELAIRREDVVADLVRIAPPVVDALRASGDLEGIIREHLTPFYDSPEVTALLS